MTTPTDSARLQRVQRALSNPVFFAEAYYRPYDSHWVDPLAPFGQEMLRFLRGCRRGVVMLPPEFMKTTLGSQIYPLWLTYRSAVLGDGGLRGMLASEEEGLAAGNLNVISWHILNNEYLKNDFVDETGHPLVYPDPAEDIWNDTTIIIARHGASKDPTWEAKGLDSKGVQGRRLDVLIADDLVTPKNAMSPALRKRALDFWDLQFETRLVATGQGIIMGNFNDSRDLLSSLAVRTGYELYKRPSLHKPDEPTTAPREADLGDPERSIETWPEVWPRDRLLEEKTAKPNRFRRIHLLDSRAEQGEVLKLDWVQVIEPQATPLSYSRYFMSVDPAPGAEVRDDPDFVTITVGALHETHLDVIESLALRSDTPRQVEMISLMHDRYNRVGYGVLAIGGAKVAMDRYLRGAITIKYPELNHKLVEISVPGHKEERLQALGPYAQSGWLRVWTSPWLTLTSDRIDQWQEMTLMEEWRDFPHGKHDDRLDGLDVLVRTAREFANIGEVQAELLVAGGDWQYSPE